MGNNILISTIGQSWFIVPEIFYFINPENKFYSLHPDFNQIMDLYDSQQIQPASQLWLIGTDNDETKKGIENCKGWYYKLENLKKENLKFFILKRVSDIDDPIKNERMAELIYRVVFHAKHIVKQTGSKLYLSLTGGRKTMSSYVQKAGEFFGADLLFHIISSNETELNNILKNPDIDILEKINLIKSNQDIIKNIFPVIIKNQNNIWDYVLHHINKSDIELEYPDCVNSVEISSEKLRLTERLNHTLNNMKAITYSFFKTIAENDSHENFRMLNLLPKEKIKKLRNELIGIDDNKQIEELEWLKKLPKADLHCHFGGSAFPEDIIDICEAGWDELSADKKIQISRIIEQSYIDKLIKEENKSELKKIISKQNFENYKGIQVHEIAYAFLSRFKDKSDSLQSIIYNDIEPKKIKNIGLIEYMKLGDLQGSTILQTKASIVRQAELLYKRAIEENVRYMEVRMSPLNYRKGGLDFHDVINIIRETFGQLYEKDKKCSKSDCHRYQA